MTGAHCVTSAYLYADGHTWLSDCHGSLVGTILHPFGSSDFSNLYQFSITAHEIATGCCISHWSRIGKKSIFDSDFSRVRNHLTSFVMNYMLVPPHIPNMGSIIYMTTWLVWGSGRIPIKMQFCCLFCLPF